MRAKSFSIAHINIRSLLPKFMDIKDIIKNKNYSIMLVSETWLTASIESNILKIDDYTLIRKDRGSRGGGVGMYIKKEIKFTTLQTSNDIEQLWVRLTVANKTYLVGVVYRPPSYDYNAFLNIFENTVINELPTNFENLFCLGDFNIDQLQLHSTATKAFNNVIDCLGIQQIINEPTRTTASSVSIIDLILTTNPSMIIDKGVVEMHNLTDHDLIYCTVNFVIKYQDKKFCCRDYKNLDLNKFNAHLHSLPIFHVTAIDNLEEKIDFLNNCLSELYDIQIPLIEVKAKSSYTPWVTYNLKEIMKCRDKARTKYNKNKSNANWEYYKALRNYTNIAIRNEKKAYLTYKLQHSNISETWAELKKLNIVNKATSEIPESLQNPDEINNFFINSVPTYQNNHKSDLTNFYNNNTRNNIDNDFCFKPVSEDFTNKIISGISSNAVGNDGFSIKFIKLCCPYIVPVITHIVNFCLENNVFPNQWKIALVKPIPKSNEVKEYKDLRPVCVLPALSKILEKAIEIQLREHINSKQIIPPFQSGFRPQHSCLTALLNISDDIIKATDSGQITALVLLDFSKAFDTIDHDILIAVLHFIGLSNSAISLLQNYLQGRKQRVIINNKTSNTVEVQSGVPQGSILGPLLYAIYTSNFPSYITYCQHHFYADDTQLYYSFKSSDIQQASVNINTDLTNIREAAEKHALNLNPLKSSLIVFGRKKALEGISNNLIIKIDNNVLPIVQEAKNLGIVIDSNLRFKKQVNNMVKKAYLKLKILYVSKDMLTKNLKAILCDSLVLSQFNYCDVLYGFCIDKEDSRRIQVVQNSCIRFIYGIRKFNHVTHKLKDLNWLSMVNRRRYHSICFFHKLITLKTPAYLYNRIRFRTDVHNINIRKKDMLSMPPHRSAFYERSFSYNIVHLYNEIDTKFKTMSLLEFKKKIKQILN